MMNGLTKNSVQLIYLISCALHGTVGKKEVLNDIDFNGLYVLARSHSVAAMVCMALETTEVFQKADQEIKKKWLESKNKAIRKNLLFDTDREILMNEMEAEGIWHMPLKGSILKDWYPQYGMREMSDNDILFDGSKRAQVKQIFLDHGYFVESYNRSDVDVYQKQPIYNFEMHTSLFCGDDFKEWAEKYAGVKDKLLRDEGKEHRFHFTQEDFYVFVMAHAYKHYSHGGTGIRTLVDTYVMNQKIGKSLDWSYVETELESLGILDYEKSSRVLAKKLFGSAHPVTEIVLTEDEQQMLLYHLGASTYGTVGNRVNNQLHAMQGGEKPISSLTKLKYCFQRLFPGRSWCRQCYPLVYKHPWLLPAFWIWRIIDRLVTNGKSILMEIRSIKKSM